MQEDSIMREIGEALKEERVRQQLELEEVSKRTYISKNMLVALEEGEFSKIGTSLLIQSFIRAYCSDLGMDPEPLLEKYAAEIPNHERLGEGIRRFKMEPLNVRAKTPLKLYLVLLIVVIIASIYFSRFYAPDREPETPQVNQTASETTRENLENVVVPEPTDRSTVTKTIKPESPREAVSTPDTGPQSSGSAAAPQATPGPVSSAVVGEVPQKQEAAVDASPPPPQGTQGHQFKVEAIQETWIQVRLDDKRAANLLLKPGETRQWDVAESVQLLSGNAGGIKLSWDDKPLKSLGKSGQVKRLRLPDELEKMLNP